MRIAPNILRETVRQVMLTSAVDAAQTETLADNLLWCDMAGRQNHGVERLPILLERVKAGAIRCPCSPRFAQHAPSLATLDADNGFGHYAARIAMDHACDMAELTGIGAVGVCNSNFFGAGAYYVNRAAERGMIALALSNSFPKVAAPGGIRPVLGTNPFAFGSPRSDGRALLVDMSTAALAGSSVREKLLKHELLDEGIAIDAEGRPLRDPALAMRGTLLPAAGAKGFGLALMVEVLSAVLTGAGIATEVGSLYQDLDRGGDNGHFLLALDVKRWMPLESYYARLELLAAMLAGEDGVRLPGELRWQCLEESRAQGVLLEEATRLRLEDLAAGCGVPVPWQPV